MISKDILDKLLPIPTREELMDQAKTALAAKGFPVTHYKSGGVCYTLLMILFQIYSELITLSRTMLNNGFVLHAAEGWLELKAADYGKQRKQPGKTIGMITLSRTNPYPAVRILKGCVFKTEMDANGKELRYISLADTVFKVGQDTLRIKVEAQSPGSEYNVPQDTITKSLLHIESVETITNAADWIVSGGSDLEDIEVFRTRVLGSWSELATNPTKGKYKSVCEAIDGVLYVQVDDLHPRGQGTVDIIVTGVSGTASADLLAAVTAACDQIKSPYDNLLIKSSVTVQQDVTVELQIPSHVSDDGLIDQAKIIITDLFAIGKNRNLNELYIGDIVFSLRSAMPILQNVRVILPTADVLLDPDKVILLGMMTITVAGV